MTTNDRDSNILSHPTGINFAAGIYPLIEITHDKNTFTMYNWCHMKWDHAEAKQPEEKNEGPSLMISGIMTQEWGELKYRDL